MSNFQPPADFFDEPKGGGKLFPAGTYIGVLEEPASGWMADFPDWKTPTVLFKLQLGDNTAVDGAEDPGAMKNFVDVVVALDDYGFNEYFDGSAPDNVMGRLGYSLKLITRLAMAVGYIDAGDSYDPEEFLGELQKGTFEGSKVQYRTYHKERKTRNDAGALVSRDPPVFDVNTADFVGA